VNVAPMVFCLIGLALWALLVPEVTPASLAVGVPAILAAWAAFRRLATFDTCIPWRRAVAWIRAVAGYLVLHVPVDITRATFRVFREVLRPDLHIRPAIVAVPLPGAPPEILMLLAFGICLTPGEQAVEIDEARGVLYVHGLLVTDPDHFRSEVTAVYERYFRGLARAP